jgi:HK97 family phage major capsid protein
MSKYVLALTPEQESRLHFLTTEVNRVVCQPALQRDDRKKVDAMLAEMANIRAIARTSEEVRNARVEEVMQEFAAREIAQRKQHNELFRSYLCGQEIAGDTIIGSGPERRAVTFLSGTNTVIYTAGPQGGVTVPIDFAKFVTEGMSAVDPLLNPKVATVVQEDSFKLSPLTLPGWDLSQISAVQVGESVQATPGVVPQVSQQMLNKFTYRLSLSGSFEWEEDNAAYENAMGVMARAYGIGFGRGIGSGLINGNGETGPTGILNGLSSVYTTQTAGGSKVVADDITAVYFSVNAIHRQAPKCAWLVNDQSYQLIRNATDNQGRPLLRIEDDKMILMGKPLYISPSLPTYNPSLGTQQPGTFCIFGDLSHYVVHTSTMYLRRNLQATGYVEAGVALYSGLLMVDGVLFDPSQSGAPSVVAAALHE